MKLFALLAILSQLPLEIAKDESAITGYKIGLFHIREPELGYGCHEIPIGPIVRYPYFNFSNSFYPAMRIEFEESSFDTHWNGITKDLPLQLSEIRSQIVKTINAGRILVSHPGRVWLLDDVSIWTVSETERHYVWIATLIERHDAPGVSGQNSISLFFHITGEFIVPNCIEGEEQAFSDKFLLPLK